METEYIEKIIEFLDPGRISLIGFFYIASLSIMKYYRYRCKLLESQPDPPIDYVDELVSEHKYVVGDSEPYFKRLYKRTYSDGSVEFYPTED
jgi:hypothetical protein